MLEFKLDGVVKQQDEATDFEGPLSVILTLLTKNKIEIRDIRISDILEQYMAFVAEMDIDLENASEFVRMAAHLVYIKTRTLLSEDTQELTELDLLISSLEALSSRDGFNQISAVLDELDNAYRLGSLLFTKPPEPRKHAPTYEYKHECSELLGAIYELSSRSMAAPPEQSAITIIPEPIVHSVHDKSMEIIHLLRFEGTRPLRELYARCRSRTEIVAAFMSVLELCGTGRLTLSSDDGELSVSLVDSDADADDDMGEI